MMQIGDRCSTPEGEGVIIDHDACNGDTGVGINPAWVYNCYCVEILLDEDTGQTTELWIDVDDVKPL